MKDLNKNTSTQRPVFSGKTLKTKFQNYTCKQIKTGLNTGFTLVELIIVITILAILATIAFTSFQNYTKDARDGNRVSTIKSIESGLELYTIKTGNYPQPEGEISTGTINDQPLTYKGEIGETIGKQINMNKIPLDPLTEKKYIYGITKNKKEYQIATILEGDIVYQNIIPTTYANSYYSKVSGNYKGFITYSSGSGINTETWIANIPSLIYNFTGTTNLLSTTGAYFVIDKGTNLPYKPTTNTQINHKTLEATIQEKTKNPESKLVNISKTALEDFAKNGVTTNLPTELQTNTGILLSSFGVENKESLEILITGASTQTSTPPTPTTLNGACGTANKTYSYTDIEFGTDTFCTTGTANPTTPNFPTEVSPTNWTCEGSGTPIGTTANCTATITATPINGTCGTAHNLATLNEPPTENLCTNGNATSVTTNTSNYTWSCEGVNLGTTASCSAPRQYTVTFNGNGATSGSMTTQNITANSSVNLTSNGFTKTGNTFAGWLTTLGGTVVYTNGQSYNMTTSNITLYAKWEIPTYIQLCTGTPTNGEIYYTDASGNKIASVTNDGTATLESGKSISNLTCNTGGETNNGGHIVVCTGNNTGYVLQACNLGNTGTPGATNTTAAYGNVYQWGRNKAFPSSGGVTQQSSPIAGSVGLNAGTDTYGFVRSESLPSPYTWANTDITNNWGVGLQGPCSSGYHVPSQPEWNGIAAAWGGGTNGTNLSNALKLPFAGDRYWDTGAMGTQGSYGRYWSSSLYDTYAFTLYFDSSTVFPSNISDRAVGFSVRCFKN